MEPLLEHPAVGDQATSVTDRPKQGVHGLVSHRAAGTLAQQPHQRRTITVVGLETPRAELGPGRLGLRRREQAHRSGIAPLQLRHPGLVQPAGGLHADDRRACHAAGHDQLAQRLHPFPQHRQRHRLPEQPTLPTGQPHPVAHLARIDRHHQRRHRQRLTQQLHRQPPLTSRKGPPCYGKSLTTKVAQELSADPANPPVGLYRSSVGGRLRAVVVSSRTAMAALRPLRAITEPAGWVAAPHR